MWHYVVSSCGVWQSALAPSPKRLQIGMVEVIGWNARVKDQDLLYGSGAIQILEGFGERDPFSSKL